MLVLSNGANHGALPLQEMPAEFIRGEKIVTRDIVPPQSICHIKDNPHPIVLLQASTRLLSWVDLHPQSVAGLFGTGHPYLDAIVCGLAGHILLERTATF